MRNRKRVKIITLIIALNFTIMGFGWSAPQCCLRPISNSERGDAFTFGSTRIVCPGVRKVDVEFSRGGRSAKGWVIEMQPNLVECDVSVDPAMVDYNFYAWASTKDLAERFGRAYVPLPGKTIPGFRDSLLERDKRRAVLIAPATQGGFWGANTIVQKRMDDGQPVLIKKTAPGLYQTGVIEPNGDFYFLVLDPGNTAVRKVEIDKGAPKQDMSDVELAFVGPPLFYHGEDLSGQIRFPKTAAGQPAPLESGYDVNWDTQTTITSFAIWGCNRKTGVVYYFPMVRLGNKPIDGVLCAEMLDAFMKYAKESSIDMKDVDLILGPGGVDVNVILGDEELISTVDPRSATAKDYPDGRPLGTIFYALSHEGEGPRKGLDGNRYRDVKVNIENKADSVRRIAELRQRIQERGGQDLTGQAAYSAARWLLMELIRMSNCSDPCFSANMPDHMREMPDIARRLDADASPELLIAAMLHDADRFFDGYYVRIEDEPSLDGPWFRQYYKPIQHPRMAADFIIPLLRLLGIEQGLLKKVNLLIRTHETGISKTLVDRLIARSQVTLAEAARLVADSNTLRDSDSISVFTPVLLVSAMVDFRNKERGPEFIHEVRQKYARAGRQARALIDSLMREREADYRMTEDGTAAYELFLEAQREFRAEGLRRIGVLAARWI